MIVFSSFDINVITIHNIEYSEKVPISTFPLNKAPTSTRIWDNKELTNNLYDTVLKGRDYV